MLLDISVSASKARQKQPAPLMTDSADATPERVAKGESTLTESGARQFKDELLDRLAGSGLLYQGDKIMNAALKLAGERYYEDWYGAGMSTLKAIDYGKVRTGASGSGGGLPISRMQAQCRDRYRAAREALPAHYRKPVELVLLDGQDNLTAIGKALTGSKTPSTARTVALERFTTGLFLLALHYGLMASTPKPH